MLFVIHARDKAGALPTRLANYDAHKAFLSDTSPHGVWIVMSGPLVADDGTTMSRQPVPRRGRRPRDSREIQSGRSVSFGRNLGECPDKLDSYVDKVRFDRGAATQVVSRRAVRPRPATASVLAWLRRGIRVHPKHGGQAWGSNSRRRSRPKRSNWTTTNRPSRARRSRSSCRRRFSGRPQHPRCSCRD
jgi:uncharacterized protein YciI